MDTGSQDTLEDLSVAIRHGDQNGDHGGQLGGSVMIQKSNNDEFHRSDDSGSFQKCLYSEYSLKDGLIFILLSHQDQAIKFPGIGNVLIIHEMTSQKK